jgi:hypothetical protein
MDLWDRIEMIALALPTLLTLVSAAIFLTLERVKPGRELPNAPGWYFRALLTNACQWGGSEVPSVYAASREGDF